MLHRIREAMKGNPDFKHGADEGGPVETDPTFIGGKPKNRHVRERRRMQQSDQCREKAIVMGMLERNTRKVRTKLLVTMKCHQPLHCFAPTGLTLWVPPVPARDTLEFRQPNVYHLVTDE